MSRFFVKTEPADLQNGLIVITGEDVKHIAGVLRAKPGDALELCDGAGTDYDAVIEQLSKESVITRVRGSKANHTEPPLDITLFQGIPKGDKMDFIIQKCVELGVNRFVPVTAARSVVKFKDTKDAAAKAARWGRIALEAAKQCGRGRLPVVEEPVGLEQALKLVDGCGLKLLPYEEETEGGLRNVLRSYISSISESSAVQASGVQASGEYTLGAYISELQTQAMHDPTVQAPAIQASVMQTPRTQTPRTQTPGIHLPELRKIAIFIGPEGGFEKAETERAIQRGFKSVKLGPRILRTETAGIAVASIVMYELGDMGGAV